MKWLVDQSTAYKRGWLIDSWPIDSLPIDCWPIDVVSCFWLRQNFQKQLAYITRFVMRLRIKTGHSGFVSIHIFYVGEIETFPSIPFAIFFLNLRRVRPRHDWFSKIFCRVLALLKHPTRPPWTSSTTWRRCWCQTARHLAALWSMTWPACTQNFPKVSSAVVWFLLSGRLHGGSQGCGFDSHWILG